MTESTERYALITGATKGIGRAIAHRLAATGFHLVLIARNADDLELYQEELQEAFKDIDVRIYACDLGNTREIQQCISFVDGSCPQIDVLINNVGLFSPASILDITAEELMQLFQVNYFAAHHLSAFFGKKMADRGRGHIINIGSVASKEATGHASAYGVTKFALHGLTVNLREELLPLGVKVSEVVPGATWTASWKGTDVAQDKFVTANDIALAVTTCLLVGATANVEEIVVRPSRLSCY